MYKLCDTAFKFKKKKKVRVTSATGAQLVKRVADYEIYGSILLIEVK